MDSNPTLQNTIFRSFALISDPRGANAAHSLETVLFCVIVGVTCGADGFVQAEEIAKAKKKFIKKYVALHRGRIPTHDTMARTFGDLDPDQFLRALAVFMESLTGRPAKDIINLDGKTLRGVVGAAAMKRAGEAENQAHIVSAFSTLRGLVLGELRSMQVANEVLPAQELLQILDLKGAVVTMDAAHCIPRTLEIVKERGADFVVAVKGNSRVLHDAIVDAFKGASPTVVATTERPRGKVERRTYEVIAAPRSIRESRFPGVRSFIRVTRDAVSHSGMQQRTDAEMFYASSLPAKEAERIAKCIRMRWFIENKVHYVLDIAFGEDRSRIRTKNAPENISRVRHIVLALLGLMKTPKPLSYALKRIHAAMDDRFLARALRLPVR